MYLSLSWKIFPGVEEVGNLDFGVVARQKDAFLLLKPPADLALETEALVICAPSLLLEIVTHRWIAAGDAGEEIRELFDYGERVRLVVVVAICPVKSPGEVDGRGLQSFLVTTLGQPVELDTVALIGKIRQLVDSFRHLESGVLVGSQAGDKVCEFLHIV